MKIYDCFIYFDEEFFMSDLMDMCEESNSNFDKDKFIAATANLVKIKTSLSPDI